MSPVISDIGKYLDLPPFVIWKGLQISALVPRLLNLVLVVAVVVFFFMLLYGSIRWITSRGDKEILEKAQKTLTAAIIGLTILFSAWAILRLVKYFFGLNDFR